MAGTRATDEIGDLTDGPDLAVEVLGSGDFESGHVYAPYYVLPLAADVDPADVPPAVFRDGTWPEWARQHGAVDGSPQIVQIQLRGTSAEPVLIDGVRIRVVARSEPAAGWYFADPVCGAAPVRIALVDLDAGSPDPVYVAVIDNDGRPFVVTTETASDGYRRSLGTDTEVVFEPAWADGIGGC